MKVVIVYETLTGTTQYVAEVMKDTLVEHGHTVDLHSVRYQGLEPKILDYDVILFGVLEIVPILNFVSQPKFWKIGSLSKVEHLLFQLSKLMVSQTISHQSPPGFTSLTKPSKNSL
jgi:flavorubredoxin